MTNVSKILNEVKSVDLFENLHGFTIEKKDTSIKFINESTGAIRIASIKSIEGSTFFGLNGKTYSKEELVKELTTSGK